MKVRCSSVHTSAGVHARVKMVVQPRITRMARLQPAPRYVMRQPRATPHRPSPAAKRALTTSRQRYYMVDEG